MSRFEIPDRWLVLTIQIKDSNVDKILSGWYGGYLGADEWRLSSQIKTVTDCGDHYIVETESGSEYKLIKIRIGMTALSQNKYNKILNTEGVSVKVYLLEDFHEKFIVSGNYSVPIQNQWMELAAACYQAAGEFDLPECFLDVLSLAANGEEFYHLVPSLLPVYKDEL